MYDLVEKTVIEVTADTKVLNRKMLSTDIPSIERVEWILKSEELPFKELPHGFWSSL